MRLTVLGSAASYADAGQACSGYLVEADGARVVLDLGTGTLANLAAVADPLTVDAVVVTHGHPDHFLDLYALQSLLRYAPSGPAGPVPLYLPPGLSERMQALLDGRGAEDFLAAFDLHEVVHGEPISFDGLRITPMPVEHVEGASGLRVEAGGRVLAYTSDTRHGSPVRELAGGAHTLLAEATLPAKYAGKAPHMTAEEAGLLATDVGASRLVVTHLWPTTSRGEILAEAKAAFDGEVLIARELLALDV